MARVGAFVLVALTVGIGTLAWFTSPDYSKCTTEDRIPVCAEGNGSDLGYLLTLLTGCLIVITLLWLLGMLVAWLFRRRSSR